MLIEAGEMDGIARQFGVHPAIHQRDYIFEYHRRNPPKSMDDAIRTYYGIGKDSAQRLSSLIDAYVKRSNSRKLSVFEFAAGYGCVSRHSKLDESIELVPCDIHVEAVEFMKRELGLPAIVSSVSPNDFSIVGSYDVVFALSFFTHMPSKTWTDWFGKLLGLTDYDGIFIFTTHGFKPWRGIGSPELPASGFWFAPMSEQEDLKTDDYGCTISLPHFVFNHIRALPEADLVFYEPDYWGGLQDTYVVRRRSAAEVVLGEEAARDREEIVKLKSRLIEMKSSLSWRATRPFRWLTK